MSAKSDPVSASAPVLTLVKQLEEEPLPTTIFGENFQIFTASDGRKFMADVAQRDTHAAFFIWIPLPRAENSREEEFMSVYTDLDLLFQSIEQQQFNPVDVEIFKKKVRLYLNQKKCYMIGLKRP